MSHTQVSRNSFGRYDVIRRLVETLKSCDWCGRRRKSGKLFEYGIESDGLRNTTHWIDGQFCCKGCAESYHGQSIE